MTHPRETIGSDADGHPLILMHAALGDGRGNLPGGHLVRGKCPVLITFEVMIVFLEAVRAMQQYDPDTDMNLLGFVK